ncbi:MAG: division/cell wall cluster transcriptional repressor MraZ [Negativicutes bacterium]|nr:division/cell wall cluster transcriptional repressor MraZ [Negativicutes bacterium]
MFIGEYQHSIDDKGRLTLPNKFRALLGPTFVVTKGFDRCVYVWRLTDWQEFEQKLKGLPLSRADARAVSRHFFAGAAECEPDKQGRILLPPALRQFAGIDREAVIIGVSTRIEIWDCAEWQRYQEQTAATVGDIAENLADLGL